MDFHIEIYIVKEFNKTTHMCPKFKKIEISLNWYFIIFKNY